MCVGFHENGFISVGFNDNGFLSVGFHENGCISVGFHENGLMCYDLDSSVLFWFLFLFIHYLHYLSDPVYCYYF